MSEHVKEIGDSEFEAEVLKSEIPVLVDFWAPWCGPCMQVSPLIEELGKQYQGKVKVVKVNVDNHREYAGSYNVQGIPNFLLIKDGKVQHQKAGAPAKQELVKLLDSLLA